MRKIDEFAEGMAILAKYEQDQWSVQTGHDIVYAGPEKADSVSEADATRLNELKWHIDNDLKCWAKRT